MSGDIFHQGQFDFNRFRIVENVPIPDRLKPGDSASTVFCELLRLNPSIRFFSIKFYPLGLASDDSNNEGMSNQPQIWLPKICGSVDILKGISDINFRKSGRNRALGVCSEVLLENGDKMHIPMLDFVAGDTEDSRVEIGRMFNRTRGALLSSGDSFHFWGTKLMAWNEWRATLDNYYYSESGRRNNFTGPLLDLNYLKTSIEKSHSALRIFGYSNTVHETEPRVIQVFK